MRLFYYLSTIPLALGKILVFLNILDMRNKLEKCTRVVDVESGTIPDSYFPYLVAAEDHRSEHHYGIDPIGILRAFYVWFTRKQLQGASTIEQQFVRVVTGDYSYSLVRKFKEQILAIALTKKRRKVDIGRAYLAIAYYGYNCEGVEGIIKLVGKDLSLSSENQIISLVARLKYPEPSGDLSDWKTKHYCRTNYIMYRYKKSTNTSIQPTVNAAAD